MPEETQKKIGICPICDSKVDVSSKKCPECQADLSVFGIKTDSGEGHDVELPEFEESLDKLLGEIGKKDEKKEKELFEEIMAAVEKTNSIPEDEGGVSAGVQQETVEGEEEVTGEEAKAAVMFECPLCKTLVDEGAKTCPGCGAIFAEEAAEEEGAAKQMEGAVKETTAPPTETEVEVPVESTQPSEEAAPIEESKMVGAVEQKPVEAVEPETVEEKAPPEKTVAEAIPPEVPEKKAKIEGITPPKPKIMVKPRLKEKKEMKKPTAKPVPIPMAKKKPAVAAVKDEKALYKELAGCVSEIKPMLAGARQFGIDISEEMKLVTQAVAAGKERDFDNAITLVKESRKTLENSINRHITDSIQETRKKIDTLSKANADVNELKNMMTKVQSLFDERKYMEAIELVKNTAEDAQKSISKLKKAPKEGVSKKIEEEVAEKLKMLVELIKNGNEVKVNVKRARTLMTEARVAIKKNEFHEAKGLLRQAKEDFLKELQKQLTEIISNSKPLLYKAKMKGLDIRPSIKLLKEANSALKLNNYLDTLEAIKRYQAEMKQYM